MSSYPVTQQLDPSATISRAFDTYKQNAGVLLPLAFGVFAINAIISGVVRDSVLGSLIGLIITTIAGIIFQGMVVELARDVEDGKLDSTVGQLASSVVPIIAPLFLVALVSGILIAIGFVLIIVPGLYLATRFAVVGPVVVLDRIGPIAALGRSAELVKGSGWQVFGLILFNIVLGFVFGLIGGAIGSAGDLAGVIIASWIVQSLLAPATALIIAEAYLRLREIHGDKPLPTGVATPTGPQSI